MIQNLKQKNQTNIVSRPYFHTLFLIDMHITSQIRQGLSLQDISLRLFQNAIHV